MTKIFVAINVLILLKLRFLLAEVKIKLVNNGFFPVFLGVSDPRGTPPPIDFMLPGQNSTTFIAPNGWIGKIWTMTNCLEEGGCDTGGCKGYPEAPCPQYPYTSALFTFATPYLPLNDFYKVSAFGGFNCDIAIRPIEGTYRQEPDIEKFCKATTPCTGNLLTFCPQDLRVNGHWGLVGCLPAGSDNCNKCGNEGYDFYRHYCPTSYIDKCDEWTSEFQCGGIGGPGTSADYLMEIHCPPV